MAKVRGGEGCSGVERPRRARLGRAACERGERARPRPAFSQFLPPLSLPYQLSALLALLAAAAATASAGYLPSEGAAPLDFVSFATVGRGARAQTAEASGARSEAAVRPPARSVPAPQTASPSPLDTLAGTFVSRLQTMRPKAEANPGATAEVGGFLPGAEP